MYHSLSGRIRISWNQKMMRLFLQSQPKRAYRKLSEINVIAGGSIPQTPFQTLYVLVKTELSKPKSLPHYLTAMRNSDICSESMLKFCVLTHILVQNGDCADLDSLQQFLTELMAMAPSLIQKYQANEFKRDKSAEKSNARSKSPSRDASRSQSPACSARSRSESAFVCREVYLLNHIVRPYIGYLLKLFSSQAEVAEVYGRMEGAQAHEAWMLLNLLKLMTSIICGFTVIGRYFLSSHGHLIVLLSKALARDINKMMPLLSAYVYKQNYRFSETATSPNNAVEDFVRLLEEISKLNEELFTLYLGKYFIRYLLDVPEPKWIVTTSREFDAVFRAVKVQRLNEDGKTAKKRSKSVLAPPRDALLSS